jgi:transposase
LTKHEQARLMNWRLKVLQHASEVTKNIAQTCRHFGISRQAFYKWQRRYEAHGSAGLCDRPRSPHRSPRETPRDVVSKVLYLRQNYHFGPGEIADYLKRYHRVSIATASVHRILQRHRRLHSHPRAQDLRRLQPGHRNSTGTPRSSASGTYTSCRARPV